MTMARWNARLIIENATAYPFRIPDGSQVCVYCYESYADPRLFRGHMEEEHELFKSVTAFHHLHEGFIKADITDLRCRICNDTLTDLENTALHLRSKHKKDIKLDFDLGIQPFTIEKDRLICAICEQKFNTLRSLSRHTGSHFVKFTCDTCGKSYSTATSLNHHIRFTHFSNNKNEKLCRRCRKKFTAEEYKQHFESSNRCCQHVCNICLGRFATWIAKQAHMQQSHGAPKRMYPCPECDSVFEEPHMFRTHFKLVHTKDYLKCPCCDRKFVAEYRLKRHMVSHTGEKHFSCSVCSKAFPRKSALSQHMWIHREIKKWRCAPCDKQFNQKVSWKTHMKSHHPDLCDF